MEDRTNYCQCGIGFCESSSERRLAPDESDMVGSVGAVRYWPCDGRPINYKYLDDGVKDLGDKDMLCIEFLVSWIFLESFRLFQSSVNRGAFNVEPSSSMPPLKRILR
jgi:hypothetical protein